MLLWTPQDGEKASESSKDQKELVTATGYGKVVLGRRITLECTCAGCTVTPAPGYFVQHQPHLQQPFVHHDRSNESEEILEDRFNVLALLDAVKNTRLEFIGDD